MIELEDLTFSYSPDQEPLFLNLNLTIDCGSWIAVAGPDAAGKTTLGKLIKGLLEPDSGRVIFRGPLVRGADDVGYVGGDPYDWVVGVTVQEDLVFGMEQMGLPTEEMEAGLRKVVHASDLSGMEQRLTHTLSGGEQQRLAVAAVLAMGIKVLVLDESLAMLDPGHRKSIRSFLHSVRADSSLTVIEMTSRIEEIMTTERVIFLERGRPVFDGHPRGFRAGVYGKLWISLNRGLAGLSHALVERGSSGEDWSATGILRKYRP